MLLFQLSVNNNAINFLILFIRR